ncbi:hypothetical protein FPZ24_16090 [Sphingomonas panacisoli]|uniref:Glycosyltransferase RgtA/B/C/D-like domain-containing protein n=1 Tax=Sphingomonas panacisoli TaxID=1813879 RepID=A0A5B8LNX2_9SPHN|nr:hypothetical protein [Sphingomonas panacisoli]QDZ08800.1 hypothetical protein FPZ24_16090 [Sphingomonas panacisoli]
MRARILLFALVWLSCAWFGSWALNPNNSTRMFAAIGLVERGDARIDEFRDLTIDKAEFDGHVYLDKAPGMTLLALPAAAVAEHITARPPIPPTVWDRNFEQWMTVRLRLAVASVSAILTALAAVALYDLALTLTASTGAALFGAVAFALGTPIWGWSTTLFGHAPVADLLVIAVWALWRAGEERPVAFAAIAGAALGLAVLIEFQAVLAGSIVALWGAFRLRRPAPLAAAALAGAAMLLVPLVAYNMIAFGTPFRLGYEGVNGFPGMKEGLFGLTSPKFAVLAEIIIGMRRGILWVAPILILAPFGLWQLAKRQGGLAVTLASAAIVVLLVNAAYVYWDGGHSTGPRHSVPAIGMLAIGLAVYWASLDYWWERALAATILALSVAINLVIAAANITAPDEFSFPLWDPILKTDWATGTLRTLPGDFLGWSPYAGVALYLCLAIPLGLMLWRAVHVEGNR